MAKVKPSLIRESSYDTIVKAMREEFAIEGDIVVGRTNEGIVFDIWDDESETIKSVVVKVVIKKSVVDQNDCKPYLTYKQQLAEIDEAKNKKDKEKQNNKPQKPGVNIAFDTLKQNK